MDDLDLAELISARLCHDLAGAVGAVATGTELLCDAPDRDTARMVAASAAAAAARLRLLRAAFGPATATPASGGLRGLCDGYLAAAAAPPFGLRLDWRGDAPDPGGDRARLILTLTMVARDALPRGGTVTIRIGPADARPWLAVGFHGTGGRLDPEADAALAGRFPSNPRVVPAGWANRLAGRLGQVPSVTVETDGGWIHL